MRTIVAQRVLPGAVVAEAEALWHDLRRWPVLVPGLARGGRLGGVGPPRGPRLLWDSRPGGRGRVAERVVAHEPGVSHSVRVEDPKLHGTQTVRFAPLGSSCEMALELVYELKRPGFGGVVTDVFFVRHALRESLRRTLERFAIELQADRDLI